MTFEQMEMLNYYAATYGSLFYDLAFQTLSNAADVINCEKPRSLSSIALPEGITRFGPGNVIEYCCRAKLLPGCKGPYAGYIKQITAEFNAVAVSKGCQERFRVYCEPYDGRYMLVAMAKAYYNDSDGGGDPRYGLRRNNQTKQTDT